MSPRRAGWLAMAAVLVVALAVGVTQGRDPQTPTERAQHLAEQIMCPACDGQSVADSGSSASRGIREYIDDRIADGWSDDDIRDALAARYGDHIILTPGRSGLASLVWTLPVAVLVAGLVGVGLAFRRWRGRGEVRVSAADRSLVERELQHLGER
ncbi:MAG TPA: cytochrome c-type biogenesis protein [Acidimicrobiales bacterium]